MAKAFHFATKKVRGSFLCHVHQYFIEKQKREGNDIVKPLSNIVASIFCHASQYFIGKHKTEANDISAIIGMEI